MMLDRWRCLLPAERAKVMEAMSIDIDQMARSGIRMREPNASPSRESWLMMSRRYGRSMAEEVLGPEPKD